jgi:hypothetical protein
LKYLLPKPAILNENVKQGNRLISPKFGKKKQKVDPAKIALWWGWIFYYSLAERDVGKIPLTPPEAGASRARAAATAGADSHALSPHRHLFDPLVSSSSPLSLSLSLSLSLPGDELCPESDRIYYIRERMGVWLRTPQQAGQRSRANEPRARAWEENRASGSDVC